MKILVRAVLAAAMLAASGIGQTGVVSAMDRPRPLSTRGLENLRALARLFGYLRYFHPSDSAAAADWEQIAIHSFQTVENAQSASDLAGPLADALDSVSVAVAVFPTETPAPSVRLEPGPYLIEWRHHGVGLSATSTTARGSPTGQRTSRRDRPASRRPPGRSKLFRSPGSLQGIIRCLQVAEFSQEKRLALRPLTAARVWRRYAAASGSVMKTGRG